MSVCSASTAYTNLCTGLKYFLKIPYFIWNHPKVARFLIFEAVFLGRTATLSENISQKWASLAFGSIYLHKLSQNVCLIKTHILTYWHARCNCVLWSDPWFCCVFQEFSYIVDDYLCLKYCIFTKLSQIVCLIIYTFWYVNIPNLTVGCGWFSDSTSDSTF